MAVLVTRPRPDDESTASALRARGFEVLLAPMLRFEPVGFHDDQEARYGAVIVTSAHATPLRPTGSKQYCTIHSSARGRSSKPCAPPASKYRRWRSRNAASPLR